MLLGKRPIRSFEHADIGDLVVVRGRVIARDSIESPLTGERCVYYSYAVQRWYESAMGTVLAGDGFWQDLERDEAITEFYLAVGDKRLIVSPTHADVGRMSGENLADVDYALVGQRAQQLLLLPGSDVEVRGVLDSVHDLFDDARDYREMADRMMIRAPDSGRLVIRLL